MRFRIDDEDMEPTPPQTEDAAERGFVKHVDLETLGRSESLGQEHEGDIADEGPGHRG